MRLFNSLVDAAESLATFPRRAPIVMRRFAFGVRVHCLIHLNHRILFVVLGSTVFVCRVTHGSRRVPRRFSPI